MSRKGIPLQDALDQYSPRSSMEDFENLNQLSRKADKMAKNKEDGWVAATGNYFLAYGQAEAKRVSAFLDRLKAGELIATGYDLSRRVKSTPSKIPAPLWYTLTPEFKKSAASGGGAKFGGILITSPSVSTVQVEKACEKWVKEKVASEHRPHSRASLFEEAQSQFGESLSIRAFKRIWKAVAPPTWKQPGRKSSRRIDTPS